MDRFSLSFRTGGFFLFLLFTLVPLGPAQCQNSLTTVRVASGLSNPLFATIPPGDYQRLFIIEQVTARIRILGNGTVLPTPFLDINSLVSNSGGERGLLGLAFHPDYATNGFFFVNYSDNNGDTVVARYQVSVDPDVADSGSAKIILQVLQPYSNHNGGMMAFGPDGYLYIGMGDGGSGGDPQNNAQNGDSLLGKMLRLDVDNGDPYGIPANNPFIGSPSRDEIWALGLRNPWRFCFDRLNGDLYIGDVGQGNWEELDFQPGTSPGGENYGWRLMEGAHCYNPGTNCDPGGLTYPFHEYSHSGGACSVTGGYVYRGCAIPWLQGTYFFGDYCNGHIWTLRYDGSTVTGFQDRTAELAPGGGMAINLISSFGEDGLGELYILDHQDGEIYQVIPATPASPDCNSNERPDSCDISGGFSPDENHNGVPDECDPAATPTATSFPTATSSPTGTQPPEPTSTSTPVPTMTPTVTPPPPPANLLAGYMTTQLSFRGGMLQLLCLAMEPEIDMVAVYLEGNPTGLELANDGLNGDLEPGDSAFGLLVTVGGPVPAGRYLFELRGYHSGEGNPTPLWPYLQVE